ncbi:hypothetical protein ACLOJK_002420 [Asimina triloba]
MGKKTTADTKQKKKKGRPSLLDLQKRKQLQNPNPNSRNPNPTPTLARRSTRRNPNPESDQIKEESQEVEEEEEEEDDGEESNGKRKEKKLKLVLKVQPRSSPRNSSGGSDAASDRSDGFDEEGPLKKRKINAVGNDGGDRSGNEKLPDYHEVIDHPMDFGTVRNKLSSGAYANLEQFEEIKPKQCLFAVVSMPFIRIWEVSSIVLIFTKAIVCLEEEVISVFMKDVGYKDVFLISSNAMRYNAPDTIYFRQARSIQELAKKGFESLNQGKDDSKPELKTVRRGRPPGKSSGARLVGRPLDHAGSDFSSDATLATAVDNTVWPNSILDFSRNAVLSDKFSITDPAARVSQGSHNNEKYNRLAEYRPDRTDEFSAYLDTLQLYHADSVYHTDGSALKGMSKVGKKQAVVDDNRRNTYEYSLQSTSGNEASILTTFDAERKQLIPLGLHMEHMYARSLARFAANLGPVAWKVAFRKIEKVLPAGMKFGPGWVGEEEAQPRRPGQLVSPLRQMQPTSLPPPQMPPSPNKIRSEMKGDGISERHEFPSNLDAHLSRIRPPSASVSAVPNRSFNPAEVSHSVTAADSGSVFSFIGSRGSAPLRPHFQLCQNPAIYPTVNGFKSFSTPSQGGKPTGPLRSPSNFGLEASIPCGMHEMASRSNSDIHPGPTNHFQAESKLTGRSSSVNSSGSLQDSNREGQTSQPAQATWRGQSPHSRLDSAPPDLNVGFHSPASPPTSGSLVDSQQPDLALQL